MTNKLCFSADKGFAPLFTGHEPVMLLLHQSAYTLLIKITKRKIIIWLIQTYKKKWFLL